MFYHLPSTEKAPKKRHQLTMKMSTLTTYASHDLIQTYGLTPRVISITAPTLERNGNSLSNFSGVFFFVTHIFIGELFKQYYEERLASQVSNGIDCNFCKHGDRTSNAPKTLRGIDIKLFQYVASP